MTGAPRTVVLVADHPNARVAKLAFGLKTRGWQTVLLHKTALHAESTSYFDEVHAYGDPAGALALAEGYRGSVFHACSLNADETSVALVQARPGPVVFDPYDTAEGIAYDWSERVKPLQRYCLEQADGVCARDLRLHWLQRRHGYRYRRQILFMDYCWNFPTRKKPRGDGAIHVAAAGYILVEKAGQQEQGYLRVARAFADQGVHFHLFPHPMQARDFGWTFSDYEALARETPYFHLHYPVAFEQLLTELQAFDFGAAFNGSFSYGQNPVDYSLDYYRYTSAARVFDYLDAGLPVLDNRDCFRFRYHTLARYGAVMDASAELLGDARARLGAFLASGAADRVKAIRSAYAIARQIDRLVAFYEAL